MFILILVSFILYLKNISLLLLAESATNSYAFSITTSCQNHWALHRAIRKHHSLSRRQSNGNTVHHLCKMDYSIIRFIRLFSVDGDVVGSLLWVGYGLDATGFSSLQEKYIFYSPKRAHQLCGPTLRSGRRGTNSPRVKQLGWEAGHLPPSGCEVKNEFSCNFTLPYTFMAWAEPNFPLAFYCKPTRCTGFSNLLFWFNTLHVSDGLSVHHQEFKTVHRATGIRQTDTVVCTVLNSWWWAERPSEICRVLNQNK
jgi:hypothetical protein